MVQQISSNQNCKEAIGESPISRGSQNDSSSETSNVKFMKIILILSCTSIVFSLASMICILTLSFKQPPQLNCHCPVQEVNHNDTAPDQDILNTFDPNSKPLRIVSRNEWLAQPPSEKLDDLRFPVKKVIISHTTSEECTTQSACTYRIRFLQNRHIAVDNFGDICYNFLIGGDGIVYEGRGWLKVGAFLRGQNSKSIGIAFIGDYRHLVPSKAQLEVLDALLVNGTKSGYLTQDYKLFGKCQFQPTESPGKLLYAELKKHSHWSGELD